MHQPQSRTRLLLAVATALISLLASYPATAVCSCQCLAGEPRTLCTQFDEAAAANETCGSAPINLVCPPASALSETSPKALLEPPVDGAHSCRESTLWSPATNSYSVGVRVCETAREANPAVDP